MQVSKIASLTSPLCYLPNGKLVCYHRGIISILSDGKEEKRFSIPITIKERLLGWSRYATRLLRFGIRAAIAIDNDHIVISIGNMLHELDLTKETISKGWFCGEGIRPLIFTDVKGIKGFDEGVYFGGYLSNTDKNPVNIYRRNAIDDWQVVYTFPQGVINHVHNIVADPYRECLWVFTGDFDEAAAIWRFCDRFSKIEYLASGNQKYRGCVAFATPEGLLYATDTPFSDNHIFLIKVDGSIEELADLSGSCIYGCRWKNQYVFSSTVEADGRDESLKKLFFSRERGAGILDSQVRLYVGNVVKGFNVLLSYKKDCLPFAFQFGAVKFPTGDNQTGIIYCQSIATRENDLNLLALKLNSNNIISI